METLHFISNGEDPIPSFVGLAHPLSELSNRLRAPTNKKKKPTLKKKKASI
jgi:hypothetical protein